jgi:nucleoid-associated protein YgaU
VKNKYLRYGVPAACVAIIAGVLAGAFGTGGGPSPKPPAEPASAPSEQPAEAASATTGTTAEQPATAESAADTQAAGASDAAKAADGGGAGAAGDTAEGADKPATEATASAGTGTDTGSSETTATARPSPTEGSSGAASAAGSAASGTTEAGAAAEPTATTPAREREIAAADSGSAPQPDSTAVRTRSIGTIPATSDEAAGAGIKPSFDVVRITPERGAVMAGRGAPDSEIAIMDGEREIGRVRTDRNGEWVFTQETPMPPGDRELSLKETGPAGAQSDQVVVLSVPEPAAPSEPGPVAVLQPREGGPTVVLQLPEKEKAAAGGKPATSIGSVDYAPDGEVTVAGRAEPGAQLNLYVDNLFVGGTQADALGRWSFVPGDSLGLGEHRVRVDRVDEKGTVVSRAETPIAREPAEKLTPPGETLVIVQPGNSLWRIARRAMGGGIFYSEIFEANREQIRDPNLIYPGQIFTLPAES